MNSNDNCYSRLTLLLTSFSLGKISKSNPSAWPLTLLPPFMWFPRANTSPKTLFTPELSSRAWKPQGRHTIKHTQRWGLDEGPAVGPVSVGRRTPQTVETVLSLRWMDSTPSVKAERKMMQWALPAKSGIWESSYRNLEHRKSHQCFSLIVHKRRCDLNCVLRCNFRGLDVKNPILTVQACPAASRPPPLTSRNVSWFSPARLAALADDEMWQGVIVSRGRVGFIAFAAAASHLIRTFSYRASTVSRSTTEWSTLSMAARGKTSPFTLCCLKIHSLTSVI